MHLFRSVENNTQNKNTEPPGQLLGGLSWLETSQQNKTQHADVNQRPNTVTPPSSGTSNVNVTWADRGVLPVEQVLFKMTAYLHTLSQVHSPVSIIAVLKRFFREKSKGTKILVKGHEFRYQC